ncbi:glutamate-5-semialdehyde dehydrogenase, partial [Nanoarchaeota archaeon]
MPLQKEVRNWEMGKTKEQAKIANSVSSNIASLHNKDKNKILNLIAQGLEKNKSKILKENKIDVEEGKKSGLNKSILKRLELDSTKINEMVKMVESIASLKDPIGKTIEARLLDDRLELYKVSTPIGVICAIFESRPDAVIQIASLCIKSGNAVILKGGSEAAKSNKILIKIIQDAISSFNKELIGAVQLIETREEVVKILEMDDEIDLIVPRGSNRFVKFIQENTQIPVLGHSEGICHVYVDKSADEKKACDICVDAKIQYPAACNAMETLLIHKDIANLLLPKLKQMYDKEGVEIRGCDETRKIIDVKNVNDDEVKQVGEILNA